MFKVRIMKKLILTLLFVAFGSVWVFAQDSELNAEVYPQQVTIEHNQAVVSFSQDFVSMFEADIDRFFELDKTTFDGNDATINQYGNDNHSLIEQFGFGNLALINILGNHNNTSLTQDGNHNRTIMNIEGDNNVVDYLQDGNNNRIGLNFIGDGLNQSYEQVGNDQSIQFSGIGIDIEVFQIGNGAAVEIINN